MTNTFRTSDQAGRSMVEMLGVLAIIGVLSIGGIAGYSKAMAKYKINKTLDQVSMLIAGIRTAYGNQNSYTGLSTTQAIGAEIVGVDLTRGSSTQLKHAYDGEVKIYAGTSTGDECSGTDDAVYCPTFVVEFNDLDKIACATIASSDWGGTAGSGLYSITVGSDVHTWNGESRTAQLPVLYSDALAQCGATGGRGAANNKGSIKWVYF